MNVAELAATLGWDVDFETIARYQSELNKARESTAKLEADTKKLAEAEKLHAELRGDASKALAMISPGVPGVPGGGGGGGAGVAAATSGALRWGRALEIANAGLGVALKGYTILSSAVGRVRGAFEATAAAAAHANDVSARTGLSVEAVQELGYAASQSSADVDTLGGGLKTLADKADAASKGGKEAARALNAVGLTGKDIKGGKTSLDEALGSIADKFATMPDGARKSALAVDLFGANGTKLIPLLNKGSKGIGELRAEAQRLGLVMGKDAVEGAAALGDAQAKIGAQLDGIRNQVITALLPMLSEMAEGLSAWLTENREEIVEVLSIIGKGLLYLLQGIAAFARGVAVAVRWVIDNWKLVVAAIALALLPLTLVVAAIYGLIEAFPYVVAGFRAIGRAFERLWEGVKSLARAVASFFASVGRGIRDAFMAVFDWIAGRVRKVVAFVEEAIARLEAAEKKARGKAKDAVDFLPGWVTGGVLKFASDKLLGGGDKRTAMAAPGGGKSVTNNFAAINVTSNSADPQQVAALVGPAVVKEMNRQLLETDAALPPAMGVA